MSVIIKSAIIHILDVLTGVPVLSQNPIIFDKDVSEYIRCVIDKSFHSDDTKECTFKGGPTVWEECQGASWNLVTISQSIAQEMFNIMRRNKEIPSADIIMGTSEIDGLEHLFALKIDYKKTYTHSVIKRESNAEVEIIQHKALWPLQATKVIEGFFINVERPIAKILERKYTVDGIKDFYISTQVLACVESKTPRQKATKIMRVAEKVAELYYSDDGGLDAHISSAMLDELQQERPLMVKSLGQKFFGGNPSAQEEFYERLAASDIVETEELSLSEKFQKRFEKQAIKTLSGVEIKIPTQLYSNLDEIEFINNQDGTVSLLIKNIKV